MTMRVPWACLCILACLAAGCSLGRRTPSVGQQSAQTDVSSTREATAAEHPRPPSASDPVLHDWAIYLDTERLARSQDPEGARAAAERLETEYPGSIWLGRAQLEVGLALARAGDHAEATDWLSRATAALDADLAYWGRARLAEAESTAQIGEHAAAFEQARSIRTRLPLTLATRRAQRLSTRLVHRDPTLLADPQARLDEAELRLSEGDASGALSLVEALADRPGAHRNAARWTQARAWQTLGRSERATRLCRQLAEESDAELGATALLAAARWHWNADEDDAAAALFEDVRLRFPDTDEASAASYALGRIHQTAGRWDAAVAEYDRVRSGRLALDAGWGAAWSRYLDGRWHDAAARFRALGAALDAEGDDAATYWEARALANTGDPQAMATLQRLAERNRDEYYGHMAARYLTGAALGLSSPAVMVPPPPPFPAIDGPHGARARAYLALGQRDLARREIDALAGRTSTALVLDAYDAIGAPGRSLQLVRRSLLADERRERRLYPLGYWQTVAPEAARRRVDPLLVLALIRQESAFDDTAVSPADAHGLMQLLPSTAAEVATTLGMQPPDRWALHRVPLNVALGTSLIARLLDEYDGSRIRALAAYNAGAPAVAKWDARNAERPDDEYVELISYAETRRYVKKVIGNYLRYQRLYAPTASAMSFGSPPNAPFDMMTMTSPGLVDPVR